MDNLSNSVGLVGLPWDFRGTSGRLPWEAHGSSMGTPRDFYGIILLPWYLYGTLLWYFYGASVGRPWWDFRGKYMGVPG